MTQQSLSSQPTNNDETSTDTEVTKDPTNDTSNYEQQIAEKDATIANMDKQIASLQQQINTSTLGPTGTIQVSDSMKDYVRQLNTLLQRLTGEMQI